MLERQKCERRGRAIRRDWWEQGKMRGRAVSERNARDKEEEEEGCRKERDEALQRFVQHNTQLHVESLLDLA